MGHVPLVHPLGSLDRGHGDVGRRGGRADEHGIDRDPPGGQAIDQRRGVARGVLAAVGQEDHAEKRRILGELQGLGQRRGPVGGRPGRVVGPGGLAEGFGHVGQRRLGEGVAGERGPPGVVVGRQLRERGVRPVDQASGDVAAGQAFDAVAGAGRQGLQLLGRAMGVDGRHALRVVHRDEDPPPDRLPPGPRGDRLEEGEHQDRRRQDPEPQQPQPGPPGDQPPLLAIEDQEQAQRDQADEHPEPPLAAPRQQQLPTAREIKPHRSSPSDPDRMPDRLVARRTIVACHEGCGNGRGSRRHSSWANPPPDACDPPSDRI